MKIRILKDIPGYKAGDIFEGTKGRMFGIDSTKEDREDFSYSKEWLIEEGWAEEVKDEINVAEIRSNYQMLTGINSMAAGAKEIEFFTAYRIVKTVIEKLNGDWSPEWFALKTHYISKYWIVYRAAKNPEFVLHFTEEIINSPLPPCSTEEIALNVIELCKPELEILFGVK